MPNFFFQRYVHGERMADDVLITKQPTLEAAIPEALRLCRNSPKSVLVYVPEDNALREEITRLREENARLREALNGWQKWWELPWEGKRPDFAELVYRRAAAAIREGGDD